MVNKKEKTINKKMLNRFLWSFGQMIMILITFIVGSWFILIASMYSFMMGIIFCRNNWVKGMNKVIVTDKIIKKEDIK